MTSTTRTDPPKQNNSAVYVAMIGLLLQLLCIVFAGGKIVATLDALNNTQKDIQTVLQGNITVTQQLVTRVTVLEEKMNHVSSK